LESIASMLHARVGDITEANDIAKDDPPSVGDELVVPVTVATSVRTQHYKVRHGDTLVTVADRFGVSVEDLRRWNHLSSNTVKVGHTLAVSEPVRVAPHVRTRKTSASRSAGHSRRSSSKSSETSHGTSRHSATKVSAKKTKSSSKSKSKAAR
ncbi:MAG TPA: LysM peptidoglycan-binding domain-containing protein, partial [Edaphobacter sp.]|nr:LysM peptidoglycan-binding domain-containing protein [Edaphobacter sp.]